MSFSGSGARQIPGWVLVPILIFGVGGGFLLWEQAQPEAREARALEAARNRASIAFDAVDPKARAQTIENGLARLPEMEDPSAMMLATATWNGDDVAVRQLLKRSSRESLAQKMSMMAECFRQGDVRMVRTLLECGVPADPPSAKPKPRIPAKTTQAGRVPMGEGGTGYAIIPLVEAIIYRSVDGARLLVDHGADPDRTVNYLPAMVARVVKGDRTIGTIMGSGPSGGLPGGGRMATREETETPKSKTYTIRQLGLLSEDSAIRAFFQGLPPPKSDTHVAVRTSN